MSEETLFQKYPSITNSYQEEFINKIIASGLANNRWSITEKIHGANSQITYNAINDTFLYGKRTCFLEENEHFYNVHKCFENIKPNVRLLAKLIDIKANVRTKGLVESITVYGEIFGGQYPHEDVEKDKTASKVQKGVYYCNSNAWRAFDISYKLTNNEQIFYLSQEDFFEVCNCCMIKTVPLLCIANSLQSALEYPNDGESVVYKEFYLPKLDNNIMEGVVIKPYENDYYIGDSRVVLKNKNEKFKEISRHQKTNIQIDISENVKKAMDEISAYITENRVNNVISHIGEVTCKDIGKVIGLTSQDILNEFRVNCKTLNLLEKSEEKMVTKYLNCEVAKVVKKVIMGG